MKLNSAHYRPAENQDRLPGGRRLRRPAERTVADRTRPTARRPPAGSPPQRRIYRQGQRIPAAAAGAALPARRILLVGLGPRRAATLEQLRQAAGTAAGQLRGKRLTDLACALPLLELPRTTPAARIEAVAEGLLLASYRFDRYQTTADRPPGNGSAQRCPAARPAGPTARRRKPPWLRPRYWPRR